MNQNIGVYTCNVKRNTYYIWYQIRVRVISMGIFDITKFHLFLYDQLYHIVICEGYILQICSQCHNKRRIAGAPSANSSFGMTMRY